MAYNLKDSDSMGPNQESWKLRKKKKRGKHYVHGTEKYYSVCELH